MKKKIKRSHKVHIPLITADTFRRNHLPKLIIGWQEWAELPKLGIPAIKCKIDTGAKTSALHADAIEPYIRHGERYVQFLVHPLQQHKHTEVECTAKVLEERTIKNSGGKKEHRYVIVSPIILGHLTWPIEISLTNRDPMAFRMLLGRDALKHLFVIDPIKNLCQGRKTTLELKRLYGKSVFR